MLAPAVPVPAGYLRVSNHVGGLIILKASSESASL